MTLQDDTTFEDLRQRIEMSDGSLQVNVKPLMDQEDRGGPMEVDAIWSKGGKKGGKKGKKGKDKGRQDPLVQGRRQEEWQSLKAPRALASKMERKEKEELAHATIVANPGILLESAGLQRG